MTISVLPAYWGDCILVSVMENGVTINIVIDGGIARTYPRQLRPLLREMKEKKQFLDLVVITHIDADHIGGILKLFEDDQMIVDGFIKEVWFNSGGLLSEKFAGKWDSRREEKISDNSNNVSKRQGNTLEILLQELDCWKNELIHTGKKKEISGLTLTVLSPGWQELKHLQDNWQVERETDEYEKVSALEKSRDYNCTIKDLVSIKFQPDTLIPNGSSIALLVQWKNKKGLLLGDAFPKVVTRELKVLFPGEQRIPIEFMKLSHHGSKKNTAPELLEIIKCENFIVSTNGNRFGHPDKESLARIVYSNFPDPTKFYFNYKNENTEKIFTPEELDEWHIKLVFLDSQDHKIFFA